MTGAVKPKCHGHASGGGIWGMGGGEVAVGRVFRVTYHAYDYDVS